MISLTLCTDKEYRKAVHFLETLRIRRVKLLESGYTVRLDMKVLHRTRSEVVTQSMESFIRESSETVKNILERYTDNLRCAALPPNITPYSLRLLVLLRPPSRNYVLTRAVLWT